MLKSAVLASFLLLPFLALSQNELILDRPIPYCLPQAQLIADLTKSFRFDVTSTSSSTSEDRWKTWRTVENFAFGKDRGNLPMITDINALHPYFRDKVIALISTCKAKGIELAVVETYRTHAKQNEYKAMGKHYTRSSGGKSKHQYGLAIDVVPLIDSVAQWENVRLWRKVGLIGEQLGLRWGGRWRSLYDPGHFEWTGGLSSYHLANGQWPAIPKPLNYPCLDEELVELTDSWRAWELEQSAITRSEATIAKMK